MASPSRSRSRSGSVTPSIDKLSFSTAQQQQQRPSSVSSPTHPAAGEHHLLSPTTSLFSEVAAGIVEADRHAVSLRARRWLAFACAILNSLCAGSITAYSLYGHMFLSHLRYSQYQVNAVSTTAELGMYLPVPLFGWLCDRYSPRPLSLASAGLFGAGYALAAMVYRAGPVVREVEMKEFMYGRFGTQEQGHGWPFGLMVLAFALVGFGTTCMYMSAVTTCAKNFGRGRHKGFALAAPIAAFGLSGTWQSQVGNHFFTQKDTGELDVFRYFIFLAGLQFVVGVIGALGLKVIHDQASDESETDQLERSGLLPPHRDHDSAHHDSEAHANGHTYGTLTPTPSNTSPSHPSTHEKKGQPILNRSTRLFLSDPSMWLLTLAFFLTTGPGETYQNNIGTLVHTAYPPSSNNPPQSQHIPQINSPATHVTLISLTSTLARLLTGTLSDLLSPRFPSVRLTFLLLSTLLFSFGLLLLSTPLPHLHPEQLLPLTSALVGLGYGAIFSLTPILVNAVWGTGNFGTNWGVVATVPAVGAAGWGVVYSRVYERGIGGDRGGEGHGRGGGDGDGKCYGAQCYRDTFLAMAVASWIALVLWGVAWRGWRRKGVRV